MDNRVFAQPTVIFLHIPKTAGSTLHTILEKQYPGDQLCHLKGNPHIDTAITNFKSMDSTQKKQIRLLTGHFEFGIHQWLPQTASYFTLLRHPVERVLSYYYFILRNPEHPRHEEMRRNKTSVSQFVRTILTDNNQTRFLAGTWLNPDQPCTMDTLALAKENIRNHFAVVGLTEAFDTTLLLLKRRLGWTDLPPYQRRNVTRHRPGSNALSSAELQSIAETHQFDLLLYNFAEARLQTAVKEAGLSFTWARWQYGLQQQVQPYLKKVHQFSVRGIVRGALER